MGKWIYVDNKPRFFKSGEELAAFLKERIAGYKQKQQGDGKDY